MPIEELQRRGILVDRDEDGYLLQILPNHWAIGLPCSSSSSSGTVRSVRQGHFQALFEAIEREQALRGNF